MPTLYKLAPAGPRGTGEVGAELGRAWTRPRFGSLAEQAPGGRLRGSWQSPRARNREEPREGEAEER